MQPLVERSTGERYEHVLRFSKNISGSRNSQEVMHAVASELPSLLTYDYVSLFLNGGRGYGPTDQPKHGKTKPNGLCAFAPSFKLAGYFG